MAKQVTVTLVDDYDGESQAAETVDFGLDGEAYEIDLSDKNASALRAVLGPWIERSRRVAGRRHRRTGGNSRVNGGLPAHQREAIKAWAKENGRQVAERGRISGALIAEWEESQKASAEKPPAKSRKQAEPKAEPKADAKAADTAPAFSN